MGGSQGQPSARGAVLVFRGVLRARRPLRSGVGRPEVPRTAGPMVVVRRAAVRVEPLGEGGQAGGYGAHTSRVGRARVLGRRGVLFGPYGNET